MNKLTVFLLCMVMLSGCYDKKEAAQNGVVEDVIEDVGEGIEDAYEDMKKDFSSIDDKITSTSYNTDDLKTHFTNIQNNYEKIKNGIDDDNLARNIYESAAILDYYQEAHDDELNEQQEEALELGEHTKDLIMYHYGQKDDTLSDIQQDIENTLNNYKEGTIENIKTRS